MGLTTDCFPSGRRLKTALGFLEFCHDLGAGGAGCALDSTQPEYLHRLRRRAEELGMYLEVWATLPKEDAGAFERTVVAAKEAGASCLRAFCLGGRRYEVFNSLAEWKRFVADSRRAIELALPVVERHRVVLGLENHKDWTTEELAGLMKDYGGEFLGVCLDTGNNLAFLDDYRELIETLAPWATNCHIKDMAAKEYEEGLLLVEVPLGEGMLDVKWTFETIARARPKTHFTLEMMTRSPLKVPCLTDKYWTTFERTGGVRLARTIREVRANPPRGSLPQVESLAPEERGRLEVENVRKCLAWARENRRATAP